MTFDTSGAGGPSFGGGLLSPWDEVRFWEQVIRDSRKTILCSPDWETRIRAIIDEYGVGEHIQVYASGYVPTRRFIAVDTAALQAAGREAAQQIREGAI